MPVDELPALPGLAEDVLLRHSDVCHEVLGGAQTASYDRGHLLDVQAGSVVGHQNQAHAPVTVLARSGQDGDDGTGKMRPRTPDLVAVQYPLVTVENGLGLHCGRIGTCFRFADRDAELALPSEVGGQVLRLLSIGAVTDDVGGGEHRSHDTRSRVEAVLSHCLAEDRVEHRVRRKAPEFFGDKET